jgi:hypothetical protein
MKSVCILLVLFYIVFNLSCSSTSDDNPVVGSGPYSLTLTDPAFSGTNSKFIAAVYDNGILQTEISVITAQDLTNSNSITISGLEGETPYDVFIWIDVDGDGSYGDDMKGYVTLIEEINADIGLDVTFMDFDNKQINLNGDPAIASKTVRCFWLLAGTLDESAMDLLGGTEAERSTVTTMIGSVTGVLDGDGDLTTVTGTNDFPVPANSAIGFFGIEYDCYCIVDVNGNDVRNAGDYDGSQTDITGDENPEDINLTPIF